MSTEIKLHNEIPEAVLSDAVSLALLRLSPLAQKMLAAAVALIPQDAGAYTAAFKTADFIKAAGLDVQALGSGAKECLRSALRECLGSHISIDLPGGGYVGYSWLSCCSLEGFRNDCDWGWDYASITLNPKVGDFIKTLKKRFAGIAPESISSLQPAALPPWKPRQEEAAGPAKRGRKRRPG